MIDQWHQHGVAGLADKPRPGGPCKLTPAEKEGALGLLKANPHAPKRVLALLHEQTGKTISTATLSRLAKAANRRWKRMRKSLKSQRDKAAFAQAKTAIKRLKKNCKPDTLTWYISMKSAFR